MVNLESTPLCTGHKSELLPNTPQWKNLLSSNIRGNTSLKVFAIVDFPVSLFPFLVFFHVCLLFVIVSAMRQSVDALTQKCIGLDPVINSCIKVPVAAAPSSCHRQLSEDSLSYSFLILAGLTPHGSNPVTLV